MSAAWRMRAISKRSPLPPTIGAGPVNTPPTPSGRPCSDAAESMDDFLRGLDMTAVYGPFTAVDHARIVQLINKTNQFNTTTRRYTSEEITQIMDEPDAVDPAIPPRSIGLATTVL